MSQKTHSRRIFQSIYRNEDLSPENQVRRRLLSETLFDDNGNIVEETVCNDNGQPEQLTRNQFINNRLTETATTDLLNEFTEVQKFEYNEAGLLLSKTLCFADGSEMVTNYRYDGSQRLICRVETDDEEGTCQEKTYRYEGENLAGVKETDADGNILEEVSYNYDDAGRRTAITTVAGEEEGSVKTEYDDQNRPAIQRTYDPAGRLIARTTWEYEDNVVRETVENIQGVTITETGYDDADREATRKRMTKEGQILEQLTFAYHPDGRPDRTSGMQYTPAYDIIRFFSLDYEYEEQ